jgi:hypothetical protein
VHGKRKIGRPKGEASNIVSRPKKKRGRKRLFASTKVEAECDAEEEETNMGTADAVQSYVLPHDMGLNAEGIVPVLLAAVTYLMCVTLQLPYKCMNCDSSVGIGTRLQPGQARNVVQFLAGGIYVLFFCFCQSVQINIIYTACQTLLML